MPPSDGFRDLRYEVALVSQFIRTLNLHIKHYTIKEIDAEIKPSDINSDGCIVEKGRSFRHSEICEIGKGGREKAVANRAYCDDYGYNKQDDFFTMV